MPANVEARASHYLKVRDRKSYEFALVSAAATVAIRLKPMDGKMTVPQQPPAYF
jgi:CO/xanthine dehydrogenase FAD-binding subunit